MIWPTRKIQSAEPQSLSRIRVMNESAAELLLAIEMTPDHYFLPPGMSVEVIGHELRCNSDGSLDVAVHKENCLILWLDDAEVFHEGRKLKPWTNPIQYE